jgi:hypothetical protein
MGFVPPTFADPDVYRRPSAKPDGFKYYEYILVYVDNVLIVSHLPNTHLECIQANYYELNPTSIGPQPRYYLGADVRKMTRPGDPSGKEYWSFSVTTYVKNAVRNVKLFLKAEGRNLKSTAKTPFASSTFRPETDTSEECDDEMSSRYSQLIGVF